MTTTQKRLASLPPTRYEFTRSALLQAVRRCAEASDQKAADKPWYKGVFLDVGVNKTFVMGRDPQSGVSAEIAPELVMAPKPVRLLLDAKMMLAKVEAIPGDKVAMEVPSGPGAPTSVTFKQIGGRCQLSMALMSASDFVPMTLATGGGEVRTVDIPAGILGAMIKRVMYASDPVLTDVNRAMFHCVHIQYEGGVLSASAYSMHKTARVRQPIDLSAGPDQVADFTIWIPYKAARLTASMLAGATGMATVRVSDRGYVLRYQGVESIFATFDMSNVGSFDIAFQPHDSFCVVDRLALLDAVKRSNAVDPEAILVSIRDKTMHLYGEVADRGEIFKDEVEAEGADGAEVRFVPRHIADSLSALQTTKVSVHFPVSPQFPVQFRPYFGENPMLDDITDDSCFGCATYQLKAEKAPSQASA